MGRHSKPTNLKKRQDTYRKDRDGNDDPQGYYMPKIPSPSFLSARAKRAFRDMVEMLNNLEILRPEDIPILAIQAEYMAQFKTITEKLSKKDYVINGSQGQPMLNPLTRQQKVAASQIIEIAKLYGATPAIRAKLKLISPENDGMPKSDDQEFGDL